MNPTVVSVKPEKDCILTLLFSNGEVRRFDVKPYMNKGIFRDLKDVSLFNTVQPDGLSIEWANEAALSPDTIYENSERV